MIKLPAVEPVGHAHVHRGSMDPQDSPASTLLPVREEPEPPADNSEGSGSSNPPCHMSRHPGNGEKMSNHKRFDHDDSPAKNTDSEEPNYLKHLRAKYNEATRPTLIDRLCPDTGLFVACSDIAHKCCPPVISDAHHGYQCEDNEQETAPRRMSRRRCKAAASLVYFILLLITVTSGAALLIYGIKQSSWDFIVAGSIVSLVACGLCLNHCFTMTIGQARSRTDEERHIQRMSREAAMTNGTGTGADGTSLLPYPDQMLLDRERRFSLQAFPMLACAAPRAMMYNSGAGRRLSGNRRRSSLMDFARAFSYTSSTYVDTVREIERRESMRSREYGEFT